MIKLVNRKNVNYSEYISYLIISKQYYYIYKLVLCTNVIKLVIGLYMIYKTIQGLQGLQIQIFKLQS